MSVQDLLDRCGDTYHNKDFKKVIEICDEILKADLNNRIALGYKARCLWHLDKPDDALKLLDNAIMLYPNNYHYYDIKADVLMDRGEYGKAAECYSQILEIGVSDEVELDFIIREYSTCLSLRVDQLIEMEKYVDAWKCFNKKLKIRSINLERSKAIAEFRRYVAEHTSKGKSRKYCVRISSDDAKSVLIDFLEKNAFKGNCSQGRMLLIDVVDKTFDFVSVEEIDGGSIISESKFYDKVNYYPRDKIVEKKNI